MLTGKNRRNWSRKLTVPGGKSLPPRLRSTPQREWREKLLHGDSGGEFDCFPSERERGQLERETARERESNEGVRVQRRE
jgi:hypothetical protein